MQNSLRLVLAMMAVGLLAGTARASCRAMQSSSSPYVPPPPYAFKPTYPTYSVPAARAMRVPLPRAISYSEIAAREQESRAAAVQHRAAVAERNREKAQLRAEILSDRQQIHRTNGGSQRRANLTQQVERAQAWEPAQREARATQWLAVAQKAESSGRLEMARDYYEMVLRLAPGSSAASVATAALASLRGTGERGLETGDRQPSVFRPEEAKGTAEQNRQSD